MANNDEAKIDAGIYAGVCARLLGFIAHRHGSAAAFTILEDLRGSIDAKAPTDMMDRATRERFDRILDRLSDPYRE